MSKHYATQIKHTDQCKANLMRIFRRAGLEGLVSSKYFELKKSQVYETGSFKKLNGKSQAAVNGYGSALFDIIQNEKVVWMMYYVNKSGKIIYVKKWEQLPKYIKDNGKFNGNHFWKNTTEVGNGSKPKPWGSNPSVGTGRKS